MKQEELIKKLESMEIPRVERPEHKRRLKEELLNSGYFKEEGDGVIHRYIKKIGGMMDMLTRKWQIVVPLAVLLVVAAMYQVFFSTPQAAAYLTFQVNPALQLTLDGDNRVIGTEGLNDDGKALLAGMDVQNKSMIEVLQEITGKLIKEGILKAENEVVLALRPIGEAAPDTLTGLAAEAEKTVAGRIAEAELQVEVTGVVVSAELYAAASGQDLLPDAYADLLEAGVPPENLMAVINHYQEAGVAPEVFEEEFETIVAALVDMAEAGVPDTAAVAVIKEAMQADPELEEVATVVAAMIDMQEAGISGDAALAVIREAMQAGAELDEVTTVTAALIDLKEMGLSEADAVARVREAVKADPELEKLDEMLDEEEERIEALSDTGDKKASAPDEDEKEGDDDKPAAAPAAGAGQNDNPGGSTAAPAEERDADAGTEQNDNPGGSAAAPAEERDADAGTEQ